MSNKYYLLYCPLWIGNIVALTPLQTSFWGSTNSSMKTGCSFIPNNTIFPLLLFPFMHELRLTTFKCPKTVYSLCFLLVRSADKLYALYELRLSDFHPDTGLCRGVNHRDCHPLWNWDVIRIRKQWHRDRKRDFRETLMRAALKVNPGGKLWKDKNLSCQKRERA